MKGRNVWEKIGKNGQFDFLKAEVSKHQIKAGFRWDNLATAVIPLLWCFSWAWMSWVTKSGYQKVSSKEDLELHDLDLNCKSSLVDIYVYCQWHHWILTFCSKSCPSKPLALQRCWAVTCLTAICPCTRDHHQSSSEFCASTAFICKKYISYMMSGVNALLSLTLLQSNRFVGHFF